MNYQTKVHRSVECLALKQGVTDYSDMEYYGTLRNILEYGIFLHVMEFIAHYGVFVHIMEYSGIIRNTLAN